MEPKAPCEPLLSDKSQACPLRGDWISFQVVDEAGDGQPYAGLSYILQGDANQTYSGTLDANGTAKILNSYQGPVVLQIDAPYTGPEDLYSALSQRKSYPLPITELQVRAEKSRFVRKDGLRVEKNPAREKADQFFHVEVRDLVKNFAHLPPGSPRKSPPNFSLLKVMGDLGFGPEESELYGISLLPNEHTVLEVRPLRAFRPMLSKDNEFSALNLYQLSLFASHSYCGFGQAPTNQPTDTVRFPLEPSVGYYFGNALASFNEVWKINPTQTTPYYPLYEDVPYSKRFEILPFDPTLYEKNKPELGEEQEHPAKWHFFDDGKAKDGTETQAFITHQDEVVLISVRGTQEPMDFVRDTDAEQVPFEEGIGKAHQGFYKAYKAISKFVQVYLDQFHVGQKIIICGHSLGGAIATLLAEALRRSPNGYDILLYTYGSPRAGDADFVAGAETLAHHRMVNNNDPIPSVPAPWMNTRKSIWVPGLILSFVTAPLGALIFAIGLSRTGGAAYEHHGKLHHFMPVHFKGSEQSAVLWDPGCESIEEAACTKAIKKFGDMPDRDAFVLQMFQMGDHFMVPSYIPYAWATLRRWQQTQERGTTVVTKTEYDQVYLQLQEMQDRLKSKEVELNSTFSSDRRQYQQEANVLRAEIGRLDTARGRIHALSFLKVGPEQIYGSATQAPEHELNVERWMAKKENKVEVQLAMIPQAGSSQMRTA
ncbi:lipase family protein [Pseudomonas frederiksbergensis]|uniref:lipase family protein n=1 Tax=Pseudomonas frederiksbergensis TaxID=104087 RepID=UPI003D1DD56C